MKACVNSITLYGPAEEINKLKQEISEGGEIISFEKFMPTPQELIEATANDVINPNLIEKFGAVNTNDWRIRNWGCLQNARDSRIEDESEFDPENVKEANIHDKIKSFLNNISKAMSIVFTTDESPNNAIGHLSSKYPELLIHFGFDSESEDICGWAALKGGDVLGYQTYDNCLKTIMVHVQPPRESAQQKLRDLG